MAQFKDVKLRQQIAADHKLGESYTSLARRYSMSYNTVRSICMSYAAFGERGLIPRYSKCGRRTSDGAERSFRLVRMIKHLHPSWGVAYILVRIRQTYADLVLQSERHYQRRLENIGNKSPQSQLPLSPPIERSRLPHDTWQIDAKERIKMADGQERCFLNITDEKTASLLKAKGFPPGPNLSGAS